MRHEGHKSLFYKLMFFKLFFVIAEILATLGPYDSHFPAQITNMQISLTDIGHLATLQTLEVLTPLLTPPSQY